MFWVAACAPEIGFILTRSASFDVALFSKQKNERISCKTRHRRPDVWLLWARFLSLVRENPLVFKAICPRKIAQHQNAPARAESRKEPRSRVGLVWPTRISD